MEYLFSFLIFTVALVNGWTDAPSAIAGCVSTRSLSPRAALILAAVCNFSGAVIMALIRPGVAQTLYGIADFGSDPHTALIALCSALISVIVWASAASFFGLPTSESHALIAGMSGAALASNRSLEAISLDEWRSVLIGILVSTLPVMLFALLLYRLTLRVFSDQNRRGTMRYFRRVQRFSAGSSAFLHGAQDSQKFIGVYMLGLSFLGYEKNSGEFKIPLYITVVCAAAMTLGTMIGGSKIIKKVGCELTQLDPLSSSAADTASSAILGVCSFLGIPTATTHAKTCAMMGVGLCQRRSTDPKVAGELFLGWLLTFPICALLGFLLSLFANAILT
ncbi:MAG: inorganic phosphate transporter [Clostridia bacterium]|nr:inorganic phosphate transporter [Clostridia bacterium]